MFWELGMLLVGPGPGAPACCPRLAKEEEECPPCQAGGGALHHTRAPCRGKVGAGCRGSAKEAKVTLIAAAERSSWGPVA